MSNSSVSRRGFLSSALAALAAGRAALGANTLAARARPREVEVTLLGRGDDLGRDEVVSFGVPLPPGLLSDASGARVVDASGAELGAAVRSLEPWRIGGREGGVRSLLVQFRRDFGREREQKVKVVFERPRGRRAEGLVPVSRTLIDAEGLKGPRVLAVLPAAWLCESLVVGPQTPAAESGEYADYERFVERNFPGSLAFINSKVYHEWLFDRTSCWYKMYARTGDRKFLEAAYEAAHFVRTHTKMDGEDAGIFTLKGPDLKYVYPRAMHIHYLLTGDERALETGRVMARYCRSIKTRSTAPPTSSPSRSASTRRRGGSSGRCATRATACSACCTVGR